MKRFLVPFMALALACVLASAALADQSTKQAALDKAGAWLALVDGGRYQLSHEEAARIFKKAVTAQRWQESIGAARGSLGKVVSRAVSVAQYHTSLPGAPDGKYWVIQYATSFAHKKQATETLTMMMDPDGAWRAAGYFVR